MIHVVLPSQYLRRGDPRLEPHKRLMAAVLRSAVEDRLGAHRRVARHRTPAEIKGVHRAEAYLASRDRTWPFSFENLCEALGLDPTAIRAGLQKEANT